ncbi:MAG: hypothetical protein QHG98_04485 [Methanothrix sp.]|uniref:hypothetical protein n=1 Tax=Methanothrix sp. TaxID=90426 RepID=UPI00247D2205|nr:hypothetical protein [Methanothrix sp.]
MRASRSAAMLLIVLSAITLSQSASPEPVVRDLGPFRVSFDLNTSIPYTVVVDEPVRSILKGRSYITYGLGVKGEDSSIWIFVTDYGKILEVPPDNDWKLVNDFLTEQGCSRINITETVIDGTVGALGGGVLPSDRIIFCASYAPEGVFVQGKHLVTTNCRFYSTFPADETVSLLESIHVERRV